MINLGLLGRNISHSRSKEMYQKILNQEISYFLLDFQSEENIPSLDEIFNQYKISGLSITYPYKKHFLNSVEVSEEVKFLNAINCIKREGEKYYATNTDYFAANKILGDLIRNNKFLKIIVLGDGNMALITKNVLDQIDQDYIQISRRTHGDLSDINLESIQGPNSLVINCCSREMNFNGKLHAQSMFYDFNYNTNYAKNLTEKNPLVNFVDGADLLLLQARYALDFWSIHKI